MSKKEKKQRGMVLLTTILMIIILTMLVLSLMQGVFLYIKCSNQHLKNQDRLAHLEAAAHQLTFSKASDCLSPEVDLNQVVERLYHNQGCSFLYNQQQYYYFFTDLGGDPCLPLVYENQIYSSHHWIITIATPPPLQKILQLRIAKPDMKIICTQAMKRQISMGINSWRYLS